MSHVSEEVGRHVEAVVTAAAGDPLLAALASGDAGPGEGPCPLGTDASDSGAYPSPAQLSKWVEWGTPGVGDQGGGSLGATGDGGPEDQARPGAGAGTGGRRGSVDGGPGAGGPGVGEAQDGSAALRRHDFQSPVASKVLLCAWSLTRLYLRCVGDAVAMVKDLCEDGGPATGACTTRCRVGVYAGRFNHVLRVCGGGVYGDCVHRLGCVCVCRRRCCAPGGGVWGVREAGLTCGRVCMLATYGVCVGACG
jgi:hypothetical protein